MLAELNKRTANSFAIFILLSPVCFSKVLNTVLKI
jgi:hypothetical protein